MTASPSDARRDDGLVARVLSFAGLLRANGVRVSTDEVAQALAALDACGSRGVVDKATLHGILSLTLKKSLAEQPLFDRLFALHFRFAIAGEAGLGQELVAALLARGLDPAVAQQIAGEVRASSSEAMRMLGEGDLDGLVRALRDAANVVDTGGLGSPLQVPYFAQRVLRVAGVVDAQDALAAGLAALPDDDARLAQGALDEAMFALRRLAQRLIREELEKRGLARRREAQSDGERPLGALSRADQERMKALVRRMCAELKTRLHRRTRRARRGRLDLRRTLRGSLGTDGIPMRVSFARRRPERPEIFVVCDISDSVRAVSGFMLQFLASLVDHFRRVRGFVFVDRLGEVTELFRAHDVDTAITRVLDGEVVSVFANSDYGRALRELAARELASVTRRTTVVILGDGRTNQRPPEAWVLAEIRRRARRVVWLCPEDERLWGVGDSRMPLYARHVDRVERIETLHDLERSVARLLR